MKYAWIERNRQHWPVSVACEVLGVSPSGYHDHKVRSAKPRRNVSDDALLVHIRAVHAESRGEYGWPRVCVAADAKLTHCAEVNLTHLGEADGLLAVDVDPGASSGDTGDGPQGRRGAGDRAAAGLLAQHRTPVPS